MFLLSCSLLGSFLSSLLGIGGAIILIPIILFFQKSVHLSLGMHGITALTTLFVFVAGVIGFWAHGRHYKIDKKLVLLTGAGASIGALAGGVVQFYLPPNMILTTFILLLFLVGGLMLWPIKNENTEIPRYSLTKAILGCMTGGFLAGMCGIGGGTILVPFMIVFLRIPTKSAISTGLALVMLAGLFGLGGRLGHASSVHWILGIPLVLGILPGSLFGTYINKRMPTAILRKSFGVMILILAVEQLMSHLAGPQKDKLLAFFSLGASLSTVLWIVCLVSIALNVALLIKRSPLSIGSAISRMRKGQTAVAIEE
ncbi:MAG: sulfite exporter TauE/SafE family protein [Syntrophobacteraceae bacterium]|nr:sulfite exporter TauE/SafE family protein [Syntrophobacteraceae bacterium]